MTALPPLDDMMVVQTRYGPMEFWRARALAVGEMSNAVEHRADQVPDEHNLLEQGGGEVSRAPESMQTEDDEPPPPGSQIRADQPPGEQEVMTQMIEAVAVALSEITARLGALEAKVADRLRVENETANLNNDLAA
jgi:hypothetical protein